MIVKTQAEFDAAIASRESVIELKAEIRVRINVPSGFVPAIKAIAGSVIELLSGRVEARGSSHVVARGSSHVVASGSSHVVASGSSRVVASGSSRVVASGSSHVEASGSSHVVARESSRVVAWESSSVEAWATVALSLFGIHVKAKASAQVTAHLHQNAKCSGGVQVKVVKPKTAREWCDWYGAEIVGKNAVLFKAVNDSFTSPRGAIYTPGTQTTAADWDGGSLECGKGLHFSPSAFGAKEFNSTATKFVACLVPLRSIAVHPDGQYPHKVKAKSCWNWFECDVHSDIVGSKHDKPKARAVKQTSRKNRIQDQP